jgi:hypothetical protein
MEISDVGTQYKLSAECGLARGNPQSPGDLGLFSKSNISWFHFLVDLKEQSTHREKDIRLQKCVVTI